MLRRECPPSIFKFSDSGGGGAMDELGRYVGTYVLPDSRCLQVGFLISKTEYVNKGRRRIEVGVYVFPNLGPSYL